MSEDVFDWVSDGRICVMITELQEPDERYPYYLVEAFRERDRATVEDFGSTIKSVAMTEFRTFVKKLRLGEYVSGRW